MAIRAINHNFGARNQLTYHFGAPHCSHFQVYSLISASEHELFVGLGEGCITCSGGQLSGCWVLRWVVRRGRNQQKDWFEADNDGDSDIIRIYEVLRCRRVFMGCWLIMHIYHYNTILYNITYIYSMLHNHIYRVKWCRDLRDVTRTAVTRTTGIGLGLLPFPAIDPGESCSGYVSWLLVVKFARKSVGKWGYLDPSFKPSCMFGQDWMNRN